MREKEADCRQPLCHLCEWETLCQVCGGEEFDSRQLGVGSRFVEWQLPVWKIVTEQKRGLFGHENALPPPVLWSFLKDKIASN